MSTIPDSDDLVAWVDVDWLNRRFTRTDLRSLAAGLSKRPPRGVLVASNRVLEAASLAEEGSIQVVCVLGYPFGASDIDVQRYETEVAVDLGAQEFELVQSVGRWRDGDSAAMIRGWRDIVEAADERPVRLWADGEDFGLEEMRALAELVEGTGIQGMTVSCTWELLPMLGLIEALAEVLTGGKGIRIRRAGADLDDSAIRDCLSAGATGVVLTSTSSQ